MKRLIKQNQDMIKMFSIMYVYVFSCVVIMKYNTFNVSHVEKILWILMLIVPMLAQCYLFNVKTAQAYSWSNTVLTITGLSILTTSSCFNSREDTYSLYCYIEPCIGFILGLCGRTLNQDFYKRNKNGRIKKLHY